MYYFAVYQPAQKEAARQREINDRNAVLEAQRKREQAERDRIAREREQKRLDSLANIPKTGTIEMLSSRTGQYHVVVASDIDDDLLMDYANNLIKTGKNVRIIPPFGKKGRYYRLAIESKDNYADAQASADGMKGGEFGDQLWVVRY